MLDTKAKNLWDEALQSLKKEDRERYKHLAGGHSGHRLILEDILKATEERKEECKQKRWKVKINGKIIIPRDLLEKLATWVNRFITIGNTLMQIDPGQAALPWLAIKIILMSSVFEIELFGVMLQTIEHIGNLLARCTIMESLYLSSDLKVSDRLQDALVGLYASILEFLGTALRVYSYNTAKRIAKSFITIDEINTASESINEKEMVVDRLVTLAEAERAQEVSKDVIQLRTGQLAQNDRLREIYDTLQQLSDDLLKPISRIDDQLSQIKDDLERQKRAAIIKSVSTINFVAQHRVANSGILPDSGTWFLEKEEFQRWRDESCSSVLWLHGIPGSGKTKLTSTVINDLKVISHVAYFYAIRNNTERERGNCDSILASLVRQLACPTPKDPVLSPVVTKYEDALDEIVDFSEIFWTTEEYVQILTELCSMYPAVFIVIDALDEVDATRRMEFLEGLLKVMDASDNLVKIFISSRENMDIVDRLETRPNLRIGAKENTEDITRFVHQQLRVANLLNGRIPNSLKEKIPETLIEGAQGMFRWVDLQIQRLKQFKVAADLEAELGRLPKTLEESYFEMFEQIEHSGEYATRLAVFTFQWLLYAQKPMSIADFAIFSSVMAMQHQAEVSPFNTYNILDVCLNLVVSNDAGIFRFAHLSVREFLENLSEREIKGRRITLFSPEEGNAAIGTTSLHYLRLHHRMITEPNFASRQTELTVPFHAVKRLALKHYCAGYWPVHIEKSRHSKSSPSISADVRRFLIQDKDAAPTFVHWCNIIQTDRDQDALKIVDDSWELFPDIPEEIIEASQLPPNPIFLANNYDIIDIKHVTIDDKTRQANAFLYAASAGYVRVMTTILSHGLDIKDIGIEAMNSALKAKQNDCVSLLLGLRVPVDPDWLLRTANEEQDSLLASLVLDGLHNFTSKQLQLAYRIAAANNEPIAVSAFKKQGVEADKFAVVRALKANTRKSAMNLINAGFDIHGAYLIEERTPLHLACEKGLTSIVQVLLDRGVEVNPRDYWGHTPLHLAAWKGRLESVQLLLHHKADKGIRNQYAQLPVDLAELSHYNTIIQLLRKDRNGELDETKTPQAILQTAPKILPSSSPAEQVLVDHALPLEKGAETDKIRAGVKMESRPCDPPKTPLLTLIQPTPPLSPKATVDEDVPFIAELVSGGEQG